MRKKIIYDKKYLTDKLNYSKVPVRQILALNLKPLTQLFLIQLFSHSDNWGVSFNQISKSFYHKKNRNDIKKHYEELKSKGYLKEDVDTYYIILTQIQRDYEAFLKKGDNPTTTVKTTTIDSTPTSHNVSPATNEVIEPLTGVDSTANNLIDSHINSNNIKKNNNEKNEKITSINNDFEISQQSNQNVSIPNQGSFNNQPSITKLESSSPNPNEGIVKPNSNSTLQHTPTFHFSPVEIQHQIDDYLKSDSKFFKGNNQAIVPNSYTEYYKEYPSTQLSISKYEQVLYVHLLQATMLMDVNALNEYLTKTPTTVNPASMHDIVKMVNDSTEHQAIFKKIIEKVNSITNDNYTI
jgi:hypothetical protein